MNNVASAVGKKIPWFQVFKYCVYGLLTINVVLFFVDDLNASSHLFADGLSLSRIIEGYAATIDTAAWVILLLIFELETWVISDSRLKGGLKWTLAGIKTVCYAVIVYAVYGYVTKYIAMHAFEVSSVTDLCSQAAGQLSFLTSLDEFAAITADNCTSLSTASSFYQLPGADVIADETTLQSAQWLALIDVVNASDWLLVVLILSADVWLQMKGHFKGTVLKASTASKVVLYFILLVCAVLWGFDGDFLDFWDAFLWIVAFAFIEMNLFEWHAESEGGHAPIGAESMKHG